jgi:Putative prokaryotic signal transducing protein
MNQDAEQLKTLTTVRTEFEASAIVSALEAESIRANAVGGYTAGFRTEAPGGVSVIVAEGDLERAKVILDELRRHGADVDWSQVDVDNPEDAG